MNLTQAISTVARRQPQALAIQRASSSLSYAELDASIARLAGLLAEGGISQGDVAAICMPTSPLHLLTILALAHLGAVSLSVSPQKRAPAMRDLARRFGVKRLICGRAEHGVDGVPCLFIERGWQQRADLVGPAPKSIADDAPWRITLSSGTTGTPKGMLLRHGPTMEYLRIYAAIAPGGTGEGTRLLCFRGLESSVMLRPCLRQLLGGGAVIFAHGKQPQAMIDALRRHKVTHAVISPPLLRAVCELLGEGGPHFPDLIHLAVGGSSLSPELATLARARLTPHVYSHYGASEAGLVALADPELQRREPACAGKLVARLEVQTVDEDDRVLAEGESGALRIRGPGVATEYFLDPEASARTFRHGWFYSGDTGRIGDGGLLYLDGRTDERINLGGRKMDPAAVERVIESHPQVVEAAVFAAPVAGGPGVLCAAVVLRSRIQTRLLIDHCRGALGALRTPVRFFSLRKLPRNANGKLLRLDLPRLVQRSAPAGAGGDAPQ